MALADHGIKGVLVIFEIGTHDAVPEIEVQAVIAGKFAVVHVVVGGGVDPLEYRAARKPFWVKLVAGMKVNVHDHGVKRMRQKNRIVHGYQN